MQIDNIPDGAKVAVSVTAPVLTLFGITVEDWTYILSAIVSVLFIIEKTPTMIKRVKEFWKWFTS